MTIWSERVLPSTRHIDEPWFVCQAGRNVCGMRSPGHATNWTFLSNHGHVLLCLAADPRQTLSDIAGRVGITTRGVQLILVDLIEGGYVTREKVGRRNTYRIDPDGHLRHPLEAHHRVGDLIAALGADTDQG